MDIDAVDDELGWHPHARPGGVSMRRARRIDAWANGPALHVDAFFQDSSTLPEGGRQSIHEYTLTGLPLGELRAAVLERLRGPLGCTHLNDMLRSLAGLSALFTA